MGSDCLYLVPQPRRVFCLPGILYTVWNLVQHALHEMGISTHALHSTWFSEGVGCHKG